MTEKISGTNPDQQRLKKIIREWPQEYRDGAGKDVLHPTKEGLLKRKGKIQKNNMQIQRTYFPNLEVE